MLNFVRINMYIYCPCLLQHTVFYKQTFFVPFKITLHISYCMCFVAGNWCTCVCASTHKIYSIDVENFKQTDFRCGVEMSYKSSRLCFFISCKQIVTHPSPKPKYKSMQIPSSVHSPLTKKSVHNGLKTFFSEEF